MPTESTFTGSHLIFLVTYVYIKLRRVALHILELFSSIMPPNWHLPCTAPQAGGANHAVLFRQQGDCHLCGAINPEPLVGAIYRRAETVLAETSRRECGMSVFAISSSVEQTFRKSPGAPSSSSWSCSSAKPRHNVYRAAAESGIARPSNKPSREPACQPGYCAEERIDPSTDS